MIMLRRRVLLLSQVLCWAPAWGQKAAYTVWVVSSSQLPIYQQAARSLQSRLEALGGQQVAIKWVSLAEVGTDPSDRPDLVITLGAEAARALAGRWPEVPQLCAMLVRRSFEALMEDRGIRPSAKFSAVFAHPLFDSYFALIKKALPQANRIGVLVSAESRSLMPRLRQLAKAANLQLAVVELAPDLPLYSALREVFSQSDALLTFLDPTIYNNRSVQTIFLSAFRARVPVIGYSASMVRAGAVIGLDVTPEQVGQAAARMAWAALVNGGRLAAPQVPDAFSVVVNELVAQHLEFKLNVVELTNQLRPWGAQP